MNASPASPAPVFAARHLIKRFGGLTATDDLSLALQRGRILALIGPNGAGKTTALAQLSGELRPDAGQILFQGRDITRLNMAQRAKAGIARSFQITAIFEQFSVLENVCLAVQAAARHHFRFWGRAMRDQALLEPAQAALQRVALQPLAERPASALAHGQKRQLEIAMALATAPQVLLLDEPLAGMGRAEAEVIVALLAELRAEHAILLVEHDMNAVFQLADTVVVLDDGAILAQGPAAAIRANPAVQAAYLSEGD
ncbi:MAG TPA: ABC transporter ATP-binding protein [Salinisphaeraceae bacterium]|nr:ABC transporter ATP-binding protein [Salinisphaeraceae bacterium]